VVKAKNGDAVWVELFSGGYATWNAADCRQVEEDEVAS
jgi:hypothetical protein